MMKLLRAHIENFRLLKEITLKFSTNPDKNLTVLRAANESGKSTLFKALQWGLYGDQALPDSGKNYRLSPLDQSSSTITVEIDFEASTSSGVRRYRIIRTTQETVSGQNVERGETRTKLFHLKEKGADLIDHPEAHISPHLPPELREVFFTDGDQALNFIQGSKMDQMKRVENAIRSLLGLNIIESALEHTRKVSADLNRKVRQENGQQDILTASEHLEELEQKLIDLEAKSCKAKEERINLEDLEKKADQELTDALRKGNREDLENQRGKAIRNQQSSTEEAERAARAQADLFRSELLGKQFLSKSLKKAKILLDGLHKQGKIPTQTIPVLEDRLRQPICICGETLDPDDPNGKKHRDQIQHLIDESRESDALQQKITGLYYGAQELLKSVRERTWSDEYSDVFGRRQRANQQCQEFGEEIAGIENKISELPDVDIRQIRITRNQYNDQYGEKRDEETRLNTKIETIRQDINKFENLRDKLLQHDEKGRKIAAELDVAHDLEKVLRNVLETMKTRELQQVGKRMNNLFLAMIAADSSQKASIKRAEITSEFRIVVFGTHDYPLDPKNDLNGASRRALTIAFILALTQVSEVEAPNVIDTPLGTMSGYVKQAVLNTTLDHSSQLILFLTHSEIAGCEDILDQRAGRIYTLTNPTHYPRILIHQPSVDDARVILCNCNHRNNCKRCERREKVSEAT